MGQRRYRGDAPRVADAGIDSPDDVRAAGRPLAGFSDDMAAAERELKTFLYANMYRSPPCSPSRRGQGGHLRLFAAYRADPGLIPAQRRPVLGPTVPTIRAIAISSPA
jgi:dGTPase